MPSELGLSRRRCDWCPASVSATFSRRGVLAAFLSHDERGGGAGSTKLAPLWAKLRIVEVIGQSSGGEAGMSNERIGHAPATDRLQRVAW